MIYYGRHGSCYLSKPSDYDAPYKVLASADSVGKLTPLGRDVLGCLTKIRNDAYNHWGELRGIAWRMAERFPEIFCQDAYHLGARSLRTTCSLLSMEYTMNQIAKLTRIRVYRNASQEFSYYLNHQDVSRLAVRGDSAALQAYDAFARKYSDGSRLAQSLFNDTDYVRAHVDATTLSDQLFKVAGNIQNTRLAGQVTLCTTCSPRMKSIAFGRSRTPGGISIMVVMCIMRRRSRLCSISCCVTVFTVLIQP